MSRITICSPTALMLLSARLMPCGHHAVARRADSPAPAETFARKPARSRAEPIIIIIIINNPKPI